MEFCKAITARLEAHRDVSTQALVLIGHGQIFSARVDLLRVLLPKHWNLLTGNVIGGAEGDRTPDLRIAN